MLNFELTPEQKALVASTKAKAGVDVEVYKGWPE